MKDKKNPGQAPNLLDLIPEKKCQWENGEEGAVTLLKPKYKSRFFQKQLLPRLKNPFYKVKLDSVGSYFWENCDGKHTVKDIGKLMEERFGKKVEPLYDRLALFLQHLEKNGFIHMKRKNSM